MFRGLSAISIDAKGRLAVPSRHRERLKAIAGGALTITASPYDRCLWLYPLPEWELIEAKLQQLPDGERQNRRTKVMMRAYAVDCEFDAQGRVLVPPLLREFADLYKDVVLIGQGNKFEIWNAKHWEQMRAEWLRSLENVASEPSEALGKLSL
jgi:MraZ protein